MSIREVVEKLLYFIPKYCEWLRELSPCYCVLAEKWISCCMECPIVTLDQEARTKLGEVMQRIIREMDSAMRYYDQHMTDRLSQGF